MANGVELATAYVSIIPSTKGLAPDVARQFAVVDREADKAGKRAGGRLKSGIGGSLKAIGGLAAAAFAGAAVADFFGDAIRGASDLEQSVGGVDAVFGKYAKSVHAASKGAAQSLGLSTNAYNELITVSGAMLKNKGIKDFAQQSQNLVGVGADLAAQFGGSTKEAVDALNAAMRGESDPIERYGISLNETAVNAVLAANGQDKLKGASLEQAKTLARLQLIQKQSADAQGAFGRESDTLAGKQQRLSATWENMKTTAGQAFLPILSSLADVVGNVVFPAFGKLGDAVGRLGQFFAPVINTIKTAVGAFFAALQQGDVTSDGFVGALETIGDFLHRMLPPAIALAKQAFASIVGFVKAEVIPRFEAIGSAISTLVATAMPIVIGFVTGMIERIKPLMPQVKQIFGVVGNIIKGALDFIKALIERVTTIIQFVWTNWGASIMDTIAFVWGKVLGIIRPALGTIQSIISVFTNVLKGNWSGAWSALIDVFKGIWKTIRATIDGAVGLLQRGLKAAWDSIVGVAGRVWAGITGALRGPIDRAMQFIQENLIDKINGLFTFLRLPLHIQPIWTLNGSRAAASRGAGSAAAAERGGFARGGVMPGWSPGKDIHNFWSPTGGHLSLSGGEAFMVPEFTRLMGGPKGIARLNNAARRGQAFAGGGVFEAIGNAANGFLGFIRDPIGSMRKAWDVILDAVGNNPLSQMVGGMFRKLVGGIVDKVTGLWNTSGTGGTIPATGVQVGRNRLDSDTLRRITAAGGFRVIQGSWSNNPLSKGTHLGSGVADLVTSNWNAGVARLRAQGLLAMFRNWTGNQHIHAVNPFVQGLSPQAQAQVRRARANNGIFANGGVWGGLNLAKYDNGGVMRPGWTLGYNGLGHDEYVSTSKGGDKYYFTIDARDLAGLRSLEEFLQHARRRARQLDPEGAN